MSAILFRPFPLPAVIDRNRGKLDPPGGCDMHPAGRATAAVFCLGTSILEAKKETGGARDQEEHTRAGGSGGRCSTSGFLEQAITSAAHCRFWKADPGYIARIWDGWDWGRGWGGGWVLPLRWHTPALVSRGWEDLGSGEPAQWRWRQTGRRACVKKEERRKKKRKEKDQTDRQTDKGSVCRACGEDLGSGRG